MNPTLEGTEMTAPTIPGDHLTSEDAGSSDGSVGSDPPRETRAVVQIDRQGQLFYYVDGDIDFLVVDERTPRDRVYALSSHRVAPAVIDDLIGNDRIGLGGRHARYGRSHPRHLSSQVGPQAETHSHSARGRTMKRLPAVLAEFMHSFMAIKRHSHGSDCRPRRLYRGSARCMMTGAMHTIDAAWRLKASFSFSFLSPNLGMSLANLKPLGI